MNTTCERLAAWALMDWLEMCLRERGESGDTLRAELCVKSFRAAQIISHVRVLSCMTQEVQPYEVKTTVGVLSTPEWLNQLLGKLIREHKEA